MSPTKKVYLDRKKSKVITHVRIRPLTEEEIKREDQELELKTAPIIEKNNINRPTHSLMLTTPKTPNDDIEFVEVLGGFKVPKAKPQRKKTYRGFASVSEQNISNQAFFESNVKSLVQQSLKGKTGCCFAYGHTGSGKTHTILGYGEELGMYYLATKELLNSMQVLQDEHAQAHPDIFNIEKDALKLHVRFNEIYNGEVYDLLNSNAKCFVREDRNGKIQIRTENSTNESTGFITSGFSSVQYASNHDELVAIVKKGIEARAVGNSNVHEHSSRSHALLEIEITSQYIIDLRQNLADKNTELMRIGYEKDSLHMDIFHRQHDKREGMWVKRPDARGSTTEECQRLAQLERQMKQTHEHILEIEELLDKAAVSSIACLGGTLVFIDLAGSEHAGDATDNITKTPEEQQECREINKSLNALKECFRSISNGLSSRSYYRASKLTLLLRDKFHSCDTKTMMIATISPSTTHTMKTIHTLQYAQLVAKC